MKDWRQALPPLLAALTVLVLALLPPRLSRLRDGELAGNVHSEPLAEDSNFPAKPPDMAGRVWLLSQWQWSPGEVTIVQQELSDPAALEEADALARAALDELTQSGILPEGAPAFEEGFRFSRFYLRDLTDLSSAGFLAVENANQSDRSLYMVLDLESGLALSFRLAGQNVYSKTPAPSQTGRRFLDRLGLSYELLGEEGAFSAGFRLREVPCVFGTYSYRYLLKLWPEVDREAAGQQETVSIQKK